jgi:uncharacterized protein YkwD
MDSKKLLDLHNQQRAYKGRAPVALDQKLEDYSKNWSDTMAGKNKLYHSDVRKIIGLGYSTAGENIAWNQQSEEEVVKAWMNSSGHRENILSRSYRFIGFGLSRSKKDNSPYWSTGFGG